MVLPRETLAAFAILAGLVITHRFPRALPLFLLLGACEPYPDSYPPPQQRRFDPGREARAVGQVIAMESPQVDHYIVGGVLTREAGANWRWTAQRPELRFQLEQTEGLKFFLDLVVAGSTLEVTGPITIRFFIDGKQFGSVRYTDAGEKHFETPVDAKLLKSGEPIIVAAEVDKVFVAGNDGARLGFLLVKAGFVER